MKRTNGRICVGALLLSITFELNIVMGADLVGRDLLFDLAVAPYETTNVYQNKHYFDDLNNLLDRENYWLGQVGLADKPNETDKNSTWQKEGGVVPWIDNTASRTITAKYSRAKAHHIVVFMVDDWGWNDVGYQSTYLDWTTPNIDSLASKGIKLTNYYTHETCVPSRAALMTGRYPLRFGMHGSVDENEELYLSEVTMAEELKSAGYRTNIIGKWHLGMSSLARTPTYRGFDHFYGNLGDQTDYWKKTNTDVLLDLHNDANLETDETALDMEAHSEFVYAAEAVRVIHDHATNHAKEPMFLYFASQLMQAPHEALASYIALCADDDATPEQQAYCAMNLMLDKVVTKVVCALESTKMMDNTVFVMMSDNGGVTEGSNYPFRGGKGSLFRGAHSVPAFVVAPSSLIPTSRVGGTYDGQMHVTDWLPTLMNVATDSTWAGSYVHNSMDGTDIWSSMVNDASSPRSEIVHYLDSHGNSSMQIDMVKMIRYNSSDLTADSIDAPVHVFVRDKFPAMSCDEDDDNIVLNSIEGVTDVPESDGKKQTFFSLSFSVAIVIIVVLAVAYVLMTFKSPKGGYQTVDDHGSYDKYDDGAKMKSGSMDSQVVDCDERTPSQGG